MTNKTAFVRARVKPDVKEQAQAILARIGVSESAFINMIYHAVINEDGIPVSLHSPNVETRAAIAELSQGKGHEHAGSTAALFDEILSEPDAS